jgi:hypothetical protein
VFGSLIPTNGFPQSLVTGDFNHDGNLDFATTDTLSNPNNVVGIYLGNGDGTFRPATYYVEPNLLGGLVAGDFTGDGNLDIIANTTNSGLALLKGNGDGTFQAFVEEPLSFSPSQLIAADFNHDGKLDLAAVNATSGGYAVLLGNGDGTFQAPTFYNVSPSAWGAGDFNGDGNVDLFAATVVVSNGTPNLLVNLLLGRGDGSFQTQLTNINDQGGFSAVLSGDVNSDGKDDLLVDLTNPGAAGPDTIEVFLSNGDGSFQRASAFPLTFSGIPKLALADINGDGRLDLVAVHRGSATVMLGNGDGTFGPAIQTALITGIDRFLGVQEVVTGDFNNDGHLDVAMANGEFDTGITFALGTGLGTFEYYLVNTTADDADGGTLADPAGPDGTLSLREAITVANLHPGPDTILFNIPGTGVQLIHVGGTPGPTAGTPLPVISDPLTIDGSSQIQDNFLPAIELEGTSAGPAANGLEISGGSSRVADIEIIGFSGNGVQLEGKGFNSLEHCRIGTDLGNGGNGVFINNAANNFVGMFTVIAQSGGNGVLIQGPAASQNDIGASISSSSLDGVFIDNAPGNFVNGAITDNKENGIHIRGPGASANSLNTLNGTAISGNQGNGIWIDNAPNNTVNASVFGNNQNGILIQGLGATGNTVAGNLIGTTVTSGNPPNNLDGIRIDNAANNLIDSVSISGNNGNGIHISGAGATGNIIRRAMIGSVSPNGGNGIFIDNASGNTIERSQFEGPNIISGNSQNGILIQGSGATNNLVEGSNIGLNDNGLPLPNNLDGICIDGASNNTIGSSTDSEQNAISGNAGNGIRIQGAATGNLLLGNGISGNGLDGVRLDSASGTMIGAASASANTISGNMGDGVHIMGTGASGNLVQNNTIDENKLHGIALEGLGTQNNLIGGTKTGESNVIGSNSSAGVAVFGDPRASAQNKGNAILGNSIHDNAFGIDLVSTTTYPTDDGVTPNTPGGPHSGPNDLQNHPVLHSARSISSGTRVKGSLNSTPNITFRLEFFDNPNTSSSGFGEGMTFIEFVDVTTDAGGNADFTVMLPTSLHPTDFVSATATDPGDNTSEFSEVEVGPFPDSIAGFYQQAGQWWIAHTTGSSFSSQLSATWPVANWVDVHTGDFNGDGRQDIIGRDRASGTWLVSLSNDSGGFTTSVWDTWSTGVTWVDVEVGDFNGDGKTDIVGRALESGQWWVAQSTGSSFTDQLWATWSTAATWVDVQIGDFDGDGKADIAGRYLQGGSWWVGLSTGSGFSTSQWDTWSTGATWVDVNVGDFNGDGKEDIVGRALENGQWYVGLSNGSTGFGTTLWDTWSTSATWVDVKVGDFNGDGKADITGRWLQGGQWWTDLSTGSSFISSHWETWRTQFTWVDVQVGYFNVDGKEDITGRDAKTGIWWTGISTGSSFTTTKWGVWSTGVTWADVQNGFYV